MTMRCPECALENRADVKQCARCGADLTQAALMTEPSHRTAQVWNSDIDVERNKQNTRVAMVVVGIGVLLTVVLVVLLAVWLPRGLSFSMDSISLPDIDVSAMIEQVEDFFEPEREEVRAEPEPLPADRLSGADLDFINAFAAYVTELCYTDGDADMQREIHQMFYAEFEYLCGEEYDYEQLENAAWDMAFLTAALADPETDHVEWLQAYNELSTLALTLNEGFYFLSDDPDVLDYYVDMQWITQSMLDVEYDLQNQMDVAGTLWSEELGCEAIEYTNKTPYTLDITFYNDFVTDEEQYSDAYSVTGLLPGETEVIPLYALENIDMDENHTWYLYWVVNEYYLDGVPIWKIEH